MAFVVLLMCIVGHKYHYPKRAQGTIFEVVTLASPIGVTFGAPVVAFEVSSEKMAATRLHLLSPPSTQHIIYVFHTADPIPTGVCTSVALSCGITSYTMETLPFGQGHPLRYLHLPRVVC
ncbi:uncharacterized protein F5147DRAFT_696128 [Suillus discolor]|uniref:Uncharacterized protein n=1 Tax=Suillus discolor TaxID=1912936 RepID=A0A9P7F7Y1_9AGAM|nr:uncharacterized protein F5147DRAFT_696128 [Suillus discolor]KAG2108001.1 hypothetical protein F5147DRAFT_696128 [Suillus discolor]